MASRLTLVCCLGAVLVAAPPAAAVSEPVPGPLSGIVLPDCRPQINSLVQGQEAMSERLLAMKRSLAAIGLALKVCPYGWSKSDGSCFLLVGEKLTADAALEACQGRHPRAQLASLHQQGHRELVHGLVNESEMEQAWIGLRRTPAGWLWSDGTQLGDGSTWLPNQPDNNGGEDCVMYDRTARYGGWTQGWSDERCVLTASFVCQITMPDY